ncbi:hypothetical protein LVJ94_46660 [Pendulispora rubella]|uniref:Uncharacterized protein n=1 Tax=Pendulispora rubella TaxID=2741070 RepID=A0ABZ2L0A2_9BACT
MAKKKEEGLDTPRPPSAKDASGRGVAPPFPDGARYRESTPSGVQISAGVAANVTARPLAAPRRSGVAESEASSKSGITRAETLAKQEAAAGAPSSGGSAKRASRNMPPERPELSASDVEWWAESSLNSTLNKAGSADVPPAWVETSQIVAIEDAASIDDPNDPNYGDRITPIFMESITPVFPESKVREVMALADQVEKARASAAKTAPPPATPRVMPPPVQEHARPTVPAVTTHAVKFAVEGPVWDVPVVDGPRSSPSPSHARPVAPPLPPARAAAPVVVPAVVPPRPPMAAPVPFAPSAGARKLPSLPGVFEDEGAEDELHAVSLASAGAHVGMAIWVAIGLILIMVAATMATVG